MPAIVISRPHESGARFVRVVPACESCAERLLRAAVPRHPVPGHRAIVGPLEASHGGPCAECGASVVPAKIDAALTPDTLLPERRPLA